MPLTPQLDLRIRPLQHLTRPGCCLPRHTEKRQLLIRMRMATHIRQFILGIHRTIILLIIMRKCHHINIRRLLPAQDIRLRPCGLVTNTHLLNQARAYDFHRIRPNLLHPLLLPHRHLMRKSALLVRLALHLPPVPEQMTRKVYLDELNGSNGICTETSAFETAELSATILITNDSAYPHFCKSKCA
jgi:hypothetical protein